MAPVTATLSPEFDVRKYIQRLQERAAAGPRVGCPDCGGPLVHGEGCVLCPVCGFTNCG